MADRGNDRHSVLGLAVALLLAGLLLHYGWAWFPPEHQRLVFNAAGALARIFLLVVVLWHVRSALALFVWLWWASEELMIAGCSIGRIVAPWPVTPGESQCSALVGFDLGRIGLLIIVGLVSLAVKAYRSG